MITVLSEGRVIAEGAPEESGRAKRFKESTWGSPVSLLKVEEIHTYYGRSYILQGASLEVNRGGGCAPGPQRCRKDDDPEDSHGYWSNPGPEGSYTGEDITRLPAFRVARRG